MCYIGQHLVFRDAEEVINTLTGAGVNAKQIERVCHQYGQWIEEEDKRAVSEDHYKEYDSQKTNEFHYVGIDGAMFLTREQSWKENKLGRIYQSKDIVELSPKRTELTRSTYISHLGDHKEFITKMDYHLENLNNIVFIADGARWIWKWVEQKYPESVQIVDYYHSKEHLCQFAKLYFKDEKNRHQWIDRISQQILDQGIDLIIEELEKLPEQKKSTAKRNSLIKYYKQNRNRMQ